jgi:hypothetical protein
VRAHDHLVGRRVLAAPSAVPANRLQDRFHDATSEDWTATIVLIVAQ